MSCYYRDGERCDFCARYGYQYISDAESYTCQRCSDDDYYYCPVANAFMQGEIDDMEEEEAEAERLEQERQKAEEAEQEKQECERQQRLEEESRRQQFEREYEAYIQGLADDTEGWEENPHGIDSFTVPHGPCGPDAGQSNSSKKRKTIKLSDLTVDHYGFSDFFLDLRTGSILLTLLFCFLLVSLLVVSTAVVYYYTAPWLFSLVPNRPVYRILLNSSTLLGFAVLFIAGFRAFEWKSLIFQMAVALLGIFLGLKYTYTTLGTVIQVLLTVASAVVLIVGLLPGGLFTLLHILVPDTLFSYANYVLPGVAAFLAAIFLGAYFGKKLCYFHNYLFLFRFRLK